MSISPSLPDVFGEEPIDLFESLFGAVPPDASGPSAGRAFGQNLVSQATPTPRAETPGPPGLDADVFEFSDTGPARNTIEAPATLREDGEGTTDADISSSSPGVLPDFEAIAGLETFDFASLAPARGGNGGGGGGGGGDKGGKPDNGDTGDGTDILTYYSAGPRDRGRTDNYNIEIDFLPSTWTVDIGGTVVNLQEAFISAAETLSSWITSGLDNVLTAYPGGSLMTADDLRMTAEIGFIDGEGGILGQAGPYVYADYSLMPREQPYIGLMQFDEADIEYMVSNDLWEVVVQHEMLHVMGVGTIWDQLGLISTSSDPDFDYVYSGTKALDVYLGAFTDDELIAHGWDDPLLVDGVPIQIVNGEAGGHWDEAVFGDELMTPYLNGAGVMSDLTLATLEDMGYAVDPAAYDAFSAVA